MTTKTPLTLKQIGDLGPKGVRSKNWRPRVKAENEVSAPLANWRERPVYKPGDGDPNIYIPREGSCHKHIKSFGDKT